MPDAGELSRNPREVCTRHKEKAVVTDDPDFTWLIEHDQELSEKYPGKWVAIWRGRVIAVGKNILEAAKKADTIAPADEYIMHAVTRDVDVIYAHVRLG